MKELTSEWVEKAEGDYNTTLREYRARKAPNYDAACFHAQQCIEKYMKARLQDAGIKFGKVHDLVALLELCLPVEPLWEGFRNDLITLNAYVSLRVARMSRVMLFICVFLFYGCASAPNPPEINWDNPYQMASKIKMERDDFKKITRYKGFNCANNVDDELFLRAWRYDKSKETEYQIYVIDTYEGDWVMYYESYDSDGNQFGFTKISSDVDRCTKYGCYLKEHVGLTVTRDYLEKHKKTGIHFKLMGKAGDEEFFIPGSYVEAFLIVVPVK